MVDAKTTLSEADYNLLVEYARKRDVTPADVIREAIRTLILTDKDPTELPLAAQPPPPPSREKRDDKVDGRGKSLWEKI